MHMVNIKINEGVKRFLGKKRDDLDQWVSVDGFSVLDAEMKKVIIAKLQMEM